MANLYYKCTFDCYVSIDEETAQKTNTDALRVSTFVGTHLANCISELNKTSSPSSFANGEITTKAITARQGEARFKEARS